MMFNGSGINKPLHYDDDQNLTFYRRMSEAPQNNSD